MNKTAATYYSKYLLLVVVGLVFSSTASFGQEGNIPVTGEQEQRPVINPNSEPVEEGMQLWEDQTGEEAEVVSEKKSQAEVQPAAATNEGTTAQATRPEGDDSVLSFNFLYYLFQKFKLSENVE